MANKVKYGLKKVHYSELTIDAETGAVTYGTPKPIPGGVALTMDAKGEKTEFYADDVAYFVAESNQGYEGSLEVALIPETFKKDILGFIEDVTTGGLYEDAEALPEAFALLFEFSGDANATRHVFYNVTVSRPAVSSTTKSESIDVQTESMDMTASPASDSGIVKGSFGSAATAYDTFFTSVPTYTPPAG